MATPTQEKKCRGAAAAYIFELETRLNACIQQIDDLRRENDLHIKRIAAMREELDRLRARFNRVS